MQNQTTSLNLRSSSLAVGSENHSSRTSSVSNKGKRMKRDDLDSLSQSSKKRAGPLQDVTNSLAARGAGLQAQHKQTAASARVTRSMTSSGRKDKGAASGKASRSSDPTPTNNHNQGAAAGGYETVTKAGAAEGTTTCSASTTRKISQSFAQASINECAFAAGSSQPALAQGLRLQAQPAPLSAAHLRAPLQCSRRLWKDIDAPVRNDMRMCTEYVNDVYLNAQIKQKKHVPNPDYMELHQREITVTMRGILIDWLVEVATEYQQSQETLFLSVGYIDAYLSKARCVRSKLQLVGITCMHIASKYQEIYPPPLADFCYITDNTYEREELIQMERRILDVLDFELSVPTTWMFLMRFLRVAEADGEVDCLGMYLAELSLLEYSLLQYLPSQIAASAVMLALHNAGKPHWSTTLEHYTGYTPISLRECATLLHQSCTKNAPGGSTGQQQQRDSSLPAVGEKYAKENVRKVSERQLRDFNPTLFDQPY